MSMLDGEDLPNAVQDEENRQLQQELGIQLLDQEVFQENVIQDAKRKVEQRQKEQKNQAKRDVQAKYEEAEKKLVEVQSDLERLDQDSSFGTSYATKRKRAQALRTQQDHWTKEKAKWDKKRNALEDEAGGSSQQLLFKLGGDPGGKNKVVKKDEEDAKETGQQEKEEESQHDRAIRTGEMTAFGTQLKVKEQNCQSMGELFRNEEMAGTSSRKRKRPTPAAGRKKKEKTAPLSSSELDTDASGWESSDHDEEEGPVASKKAGRKSSSSFSRDDGEEDDYKERLESLDLNTSVYSKSQELENGFQVPQSVWGRLYNYQKVCVQWLWELHQQRVGGILGDEMGLGKTIQVIAFLSGMYLTHMKKESKSWKSSFGPILIVCPATGKR